MKPPIGVQGEELLQPGHGVEHQIPRTRRIRLLQGSDIDGWRGVVGWNLAAWPVSGLVSGERVGSRHGSATSNGGSGGGGVRGPTARAAVLAATVLAAAL